MTMESCTSHYGLMEQVMSWQKIIICTYNTNSLLRLAIYTTMTELKNHNRIPSLLLELIDYCNEYLTCENPNEFEQQHRSHT